MKERREKDLPPKGSPSLSKRDVLKVIKHHPKVKDKKLRLDEIEAVLEAYADVVKVSLYHGIKVPLPNVGFYFIKKHKGWRGRTIEVSKQIGHNSVRKRQYVDTKPDYYTLEFHFKNSMTNDFINRSYAVQDLENHDFKAQFDETRKRIDKPDMNKPDVDNEEEYDLYQSIVREQDRNNREKEFRLNKYYKKRKSKDKIDAETEQEYRDLVDKLTKERYERIDDAYSKRHKRHLRRIRKMQYEKRNHKQWT